MKEEGGIRCMKQRAPWKILLSYVWITLGSAVYALGFCWCYEPNQIGFGGITGIGQILNYFVPLIPIGVVVIVLNVPLFLGGTSAGKLSVRHGALIALDRLD